MILWIIIEIIILMCIIDYIMNSIHHNEKCFFCWGSERCTNCIFCFKCFSCHHCKIMRECNDCHYCKIMRECEECHYCSFLIKCDVCYNCVNCKECYNCTNIENMGQNNLQISTKKGFWIFPKSFFVEQEKSQIFPIQQKCYNRYRL